MSHSTVEIDTSQLPKEIAVIEYPADVNNIDKMLQTMGGLTSISQVLSGEQKRMEIKFQPDNEFCKSLNGDVQANAALLLRVKVRRSKRNPEKPSTSHIEVLGHCKKSYTFECDYQFLPVVKDKETGQGIFIRDELVPKSVVDVDYFSRSCLATFCVPYQFARSDSLHSNIHRIDPKDDGQADILGVLQKPVYDSREVVAFSLTEPFPLRPDPVVAKRMKIKYVSDEQLQRVRTLFDEIPCWTRFGLLYESGISNDKLKHITPSVAYLFSNGPWRTMYVRYGYDPRKDFKSRYYQTFDLRLRYRTGMVDFVNARKPATRIQDPERTSSDAESLLQVPDYPYLEEGKLPRSRQWILRYCDLRISKIKEMLDKIPTPLAGATCNEKTGWLPLGFDAQVRQIINSSFKDTMREYYKKQKMQDEPEEDDYISDDNEPDRDSDEYDDVPEDDFDVELEQVKMEQMQMDDAEEIIKLPIIL